MGIEEYADNLPQYYAGLIPQTLKKYLDRSSFKSFLDCGCGDGSLLFAMKNNGYFKGRKINALDLSKKRIELVKKVDQNINAFVDNAETMRKINSYSIDFFTSTHVIEHVDDIKMLKAIDRITKRGAVIYIGTIFKKWYGWYYNRKDGKWVMDVTHLREYEKDEELLGLIDKKKFKIIENRKSQLYFPIIDFIVRRLSLLGLIRDRNFFVKNPIFNVFRKVKIPAPGYYNWEIVLKKI